MLDEDVSPTRPDSKSRLYIGNQADLRSAVFVMSACVKGTVGNANLIRSMRSEDAVLETFRAHD